MTHVASQHFKHHKEMKHKSSDTFFGCFVVLELDISHLSIFKDLSPMGFVDLFLQLAMKKKSRYIEITQRLYQFCKCSKKSHQIDSIAILQGICGLFSSFQDFKFSVEIYALWCLFYT